MTLLIGDQQVVSMHYKLTDNDGNLIDSSEGKEPLNYLHGAGNIIPGLEKALTGKTEGDSLTVKVPPEEGYGIVHQELIQTVDRAAFQGVDTIEPGMSFQGQSEEGAVQQIVVTAVDGDKVTVDANHPLAGIELNFDVEVISIRAATEDEIAHGHVH